LPHCVSAASSSTTLSGKFSARLLVSFWRDIRKASISKDSRLRDLGAKTAAKGGADGDLSNASTLGSLAALGDLDAAFTLAGKQTLDTLSRALAASGLEALIWPTSRAMRADPRFLPLVEKLGLMEYWGATKSQLDACEAEDVPFCRELKAAKP